MSSNFCSIVASFLAYGVLHMRGVLGKAGWRWLFLVEYVSSLISVHITQQATQGYYNIYHRLCDILHDATLAYTDEEVVPAQWLV
jgi:hypothetical protein